MIAGHSGSGWQTIIADLALILFMVSVSATGRTDADSVTDAPQLAQAEPSAIYRPGNGAPPLVGWLALQPDDPRQLLTVTARLAEGRADSASAAALSLAAEARAAGRRVRVVLEPGIRADLVAVLAYDNPAGSWHDTCSAPANGRAAPDGQRDIACN